MTERWERELEKLRPLGPDEGARERVGSVPTPDRGNGPRAGRRLVVIALSFLLFLGAGSFAWRAFDGSPEPSPADPPQPATMRITCTADGVDITPSSIEGGPQGFDVEVEKRDSQAVFTRLASGPAVDGLDEGYWALPEGGTSTPAPGTWMIGCYPKDDVPEGTREEILATPGLEPVEVTDPGGSFRSSTLDCAGAGIESGSGRTRAPFDAPADGVIDTIVTGLMPADVVELAGWGLPPVPYDTCEVMRSMSTYRIVRDGRVVGAFYLFRQDVHEFAYISLESCAGSGTGIGAQVVYPPTSGSTSTDIVTDTDPIPPSIVEGGAEAITLEIGNRTLAWADEMGAESLGTQDLSAAMDRLSEAIVGRDSSDDDWWLHVQELAARRTYLCELLPSDHAYRGGEYCA